MRNIGYTWIDPWNVDHLGTWLGSQNICAHEVHISPHPPAQLGQTLTLEKPHHLPLSEYPHSPETQILCPYSIEYPSQIGSQGNAEYYKTSSKVKSFTRCKAEFRLPDTARNTSNKVTGPCILPKPQSLHAPSPLSNPVHNFEGTHGLVSKTYAVLQQSSVLPSHLYQRTWEADCAHDITSKQWEILWRDIPKIYRSIAQQETAYKILVLYPSPPSLYLPKCMVKLLAVQGCQGKLSAYPRTTSLKAMTSSGWYLI